MSVIRAVLFDLDDTLWPIVPVIKRAEDLLHSWLADNVPAVARRVSIESMRARRQELMAIDPVYQLDLRKLRHAVLAEAFHDAGEDLAMVDEAMKIFSRARNEVTPFEDVIPTLDKLRDRVALGSVSNGVADLDAIGMAHYFRTSVAAHHFGCAKPDAAIFHAACDALGVKPSEAVYVGDDPLLDVEGAHNAGLEAVWIRRQDVTAARSLSEHARPALVCSNLHDLYNWLDQRMVKV